MITKSKIGRDLIGYSKGEIEEKKLLKLFLEEKAVCLRVLQSKEDREVKLVEIDGKRYILKREKGRGIVDTFLGSKAVMSYRNLLKLRERGFTKVFDIHFVAEKRRGMSVEETYILMEYIEGDLPRTIDAYERVMEAIKELHSLGCYHGDCKPKNFIIRDGEVFLIDSKFKRSYSLSLGKCKDVVRLQRRTEETLPIKKHFKGYRLSPAYYLAILLIYKKEIINGVEFLKEVL